MYATEVKDMWYGIALPAWLRAFDCRSEAGKEFASRTPQGRCLTGLERAEVDLGLCGEGYERYSTVPVSCATYIDSCTATQAELSRQVEDMVRQATKLYQEYQHQRTLPSVQGQGGSCLYLPVAVCMSNFGWCVVSDLRTVVVRPFV
jgi:hypothetical protein